MKPDAFTADQLPSTSEDLRARLRVAEETLRAIRANEVDALVIGPGGREQICTLDGADEPYRIFVEAMGEGAATIAPDGIILYCNASFARLLNEPVEQVIGSSIYQFVTPENEGHLRALLWEGITGCAKRDFKLLVS